MFLLRKEAIPENKYFDFSFFCYIFNFFSLFFNESFNFFGLLATTLTVWFFDFITQKGKRKKIQDSFNEH